MPQNAPQNILPFDPIYSPIKLLFVNSPLHTEHKVGVFMREVETLYRIGELPLADFTQLQTTVKTMLTKHRHTVAGLGALEQWQRNAFAAQVGQAMLQVVETESLYECEEAATMLKDQLGIGKTAHALLREPRASRHTAGGEVIPFSGRIENARANAAASSKNHRQ